MELIITPMAMISIGIAAFLAGSMFNVGLVLSEIILQKLGFVKDTKNEPDIHIVNVVRETSDAMSDLANSLAKSYEEKQEADKEDFDEALKDTLENLHKEVSEEE